jgi:hypothetical protein
MEIRSLVETMIDAVGAAWSLRQAKAIAMAGLENAWILIGPITSYLRFPRSARRAFSLPLLYTQQNVELVSYKVSHCRSASLWGWMSPR